MLLRTPVKMENYPFRAFNPDGSQAPLGRGGFIAHGRKQQEEAPPPPPTFTEAQLKSAEKESFQQGYLQGMEEGKKIADLEQAQQTEKLIELLGGMVERFSESLAAHHALLEEKKAELPKLAVAIARKVAGAALKDDPAAAIGELVAQCFPLAAGEAKLVITVHESVAHALEEKLVTAFAGNDQVGEIVIAPDAAIAPHDCRIEWKDGRAERSTQEIWGEIERILGVSSESALNINTTE